MDPFTMVVDWDMSCLTNDFGKLRVLDLIEDELSDDELDWIECFPDGETCLESLETLINIDALERLIARSPSLRKLRLNRHVSFEQLHRLMVKAPLLTHLGTGSFSPLEIGQQGGQEPDLVSPFAASKSLVSSISFSKGSFASLVLTPEAKMPFKRFVEIERVALVNYSKDYGRLVVIVDIIDQNRALVDAPDMMRYQMNFKRLSLTDIKIDISRVQTKKKLIEAMEAADAKNKWESNSWGRKLIVQKRRASLNDFDRFKLRGICLRDGSSCNCISC